MENSTCALVLTISVVASGCVSLQQPVKMDPHRPIETEHGYQQDGFDLDRGDMVNQLSRERASASAVSRARTLATVSVILASAGGALIGWPIGEAAGGSDHPHWPLAYAGGAALGLAIPMALFASSSIGSAVDAHNRVTGIDKDARATPPRAADHGFFGTPTRQGRANKPYCVLDQATNAGASY
jgi:hypothetical protein